jgi:hypothetical protein
MTLYLRYQELGGFHRAGNIDGAIVLTNDNSKIAALLMLARHTENHCLTLLHKGVLNDEDRAILSDYIQYNKALINDHVNRIRKFELLLQPVRMDTSLAAPDSKYGNAPPLIQMGQPSPQPHAVPEPIIVTPATVASAPPAAVPTITIDTPQIPTKIEEPVNSLFGATTRSTPGLKPLLSSLTGLAGLGSLQSFTSSTRNNPIAPSIMTPSQRVDAALAAGKSIAVQPQPQPQPVVHGMGVKS